MSRWRLWTMLFASWCDWKYKSYILSKFRNNFPTMFVTVPWTSTLIDADGERERSRLLTVKSKNKINQKAKYFTKISNKFKINNLPESFPVAAFAEVCFNRRCCRRSLSSAFLCSCFAAIFFRLSWSCCRFCSATTEIKIVKWNNHEKQ